VKLCKYCNTEQPDEAFTVCRIVRGKVYRRLRCQECKRACANKRRNDLRRWLCDYKRILCCVHCGFADHRALAFHHDGVQDKEFNIADMVRHAHSRANILKEIGKCTVLCANCHSITHFEERLAARSGPDSLPAVGVDDDADAGPEERPTGVRKVCRYCLVEQDESAFEVCKVIGSKLYRRRKCRACKRATQNRRRQALRAWLEKVKKTLRCAECGFSDYRALEFHHPDGEEKDFAIGEMVKDNRSIAAVEREIAKCTILCGNCHRLTHYMDPVPS